MEPFLNETPTQTQASESTFAPWRCRRQRSQGPLRKRQSTSAPTAQPAGGRGEVATAPLAPHTSANLQTTHKHFLLQC